MHELHLSDKLSPLFCSSLQTIGVTIGLRGLSRKR